MGTIGNQDSRRNQGSLWAFNQDSQGKQGNLGNQASQGKQGNLGNQDSKGKQGKIAVKAISEKEVTSTI